MVGRGVLAATVGSFALGACAAPTEHTDLRPDGPPEVLAVLVSDDSAGDGIIETATACKLGDNKRPGLVPANPDGPAQVCPDDLMMGVDEVTDTVPLDWYVRIEFDELLNPAVEELLPIKDSNGMDTGLFSGSLLNTQPVTLKCAGADVAYDGYYDPSGNAYTWPVGPSLFVAPTDTVRIATGTECEVSIKPDVIVDKQGERVPSDQLGPYKFKIAPLTFVGSTPAVPQDLTMPETIDPAAPVVIQFNAQVAARSLLPAEVSILEVADCTQSTGTARTAVIASDQDPTSIDISVAGAAAGDAWLHSKAYLITFTEGADVKDVAGGIGTLPAPADFTLCFLTDV